VATVKVVTGAEAGEDRAGNDGALEVLARAASDDLCQTWSGGQNLDLQEKNASNESSIFSSDSWEQSFLEGVRCIRLEFLRCQTNWLIVKLISIEKPTGYTGTFTSNLSDGGDVKVKTTRKATRKPRVLLKAVILRKKKRPKSSRIKMTSLSTKLSTESEVESEQVTLPFLVKESPAQYEQKDGQ